MITLSHEDQLFLRDRSTYSYGPTLDITLHLNSPEDADAVLRAIAEDAQVCADAALVGTANALDLHRVAWLPEGLRAIGVTWSFIGGEPSELCGFIYPPHLERATGFQWFRREDLVRPELIALHLAAIALIRRVHRTVPLKRASVLEEVYDTGSTMRAVALLRPVADAAGWSYQTWPTEPEFAFVSLE